MNHTQGHIASKSTVQSGMQEHLRSPNLGCSNSTWMFLLNLPNTRVHGLKQRTNLLYHKGRKTLSGTFIEFTRTRKKPPSVPLDAFPSLLPQA